ncbi:MAG: M18 family aminopeptidase [archaeon]|nr:M18 family aminopeptidase [archaeon]
MLSKEIFDKAKSFGEQAVEMLSTSTSAWNFTATCKAKLIEGGFHQIYENDIWQLKPNDKVFYTRNKSCIIAISVGGQFNSEKGCFKIIGAHTDSPSLRIAPNCYNPSGDFERYNIETYGGGLWHTWLDRDLSICGKVVFQKEGKLQSKIILAKDPIFVIPNCPPHLCVDRNNININKESHLKPLIATVTSSDLFETEEEKKEWKNQKLGITLGKVILNELKEDIKPEDIIDYDLVLYDTQKPTLCGIHKEFLSSGRLDNLGSSVPATFATVEAAKDEFLSKECGINITALFDNEEIGSLTYQGANSNFFYHHLERIFEAANEGKFNKNIFLSFVSRSFMFSADLAHSFNPNYAEKFQPQHKNLMQKGVVVKINCTGKYSSDADTGAVLKTLAKKCNCPLQEFIVRQDSPCGTTIGPITSAKLGIKSADIGISQLAMHSIRETLGVIDLYYYKNLFIEFFNSYETLSQELYNE